MKVLVLQERGRKRIKKLFSSCAITRAMAKKLGLAEPKIQKMIYVWISMRQFDLRCQNQKVRFPLRINILSLKVMFLVYRKC